MMKRGNLILLAVSVVLALGTSLVIVRELQTQTKKPAAAQVPMQQVVVVKKNLPAHAKIQQQDVELKRVPDSGVNSGTAKQVSQVVGQYTSTNWVPGQQVLTAMYNNGKNSSFAATIPKGERAFTIPDSAVMGVDHLVVPGNHVDILDYHQGQKGTKEFTTLTNLLVLFVDQIQPAATPDQKQTGGTGGDYMTVAVTPKQAQTLAKMVESGKLHILLYGTKK